jgi:hypothetical protein
MIDRTSTRRSDEHLASILHETQNWTVNGPDGKILCEVASLQCAVVRAVELEALGHHIVALIRKRAPEIVVFSGQIGNLFDQFLNPREFLIALRAMKG